ncbi:uncharacterized protein LOC127290358 [Leptopilina boulardi]|uniref:uncharacterized protein LOC127290358 n=1 Tax=Leptopilina boulardi TaxID=63433 RepID=UPI0021F68A65|nr:uncharacterized protein LOC127290358 [Leptopilina boulardi]
MVSANGLVVLNRGKEITFRRGTSGSILDITIASPRLARRIKEWKVLDEETMSDHQYIEFSVSEEIPRGHEKLQRSSKCPSWNLKRLNREKLVESLEESRLVHELNWMTKPVSLKGTVREARQVIVDACNHAMPRRQTRKTGKGSMYWWSKELACLRRKSHAARRKYTHSKGDSELREKWHEARLIFKKAVRSSQRRCWQDLIGESERDPCGLAFKIVTKKLVPRQKISSLDDPIWVLEIIRTLFPHAEPIQREDFTECVVSKEELFTLEEL